MQPPILKVGFPLRALTPGGVRRFVLQLARELARRPGQCEVHAFIDDQRMADELTGCQLHYVAGKNRVIWDYLSFPLVARHHPIDYFIYPNNIIPVSNLLLRGAKRINVVLDLAYFDKDLNEYKFLEAIYHRRLMGLSCRIADRTVAISDSTRQDLLSILRVKASKLSVIHLGIEPVFSAPIPTARNSVILSKLKLRHPYLFYCGSLSPRKNMLRALKAFKELEHQIPHVIYLAGGNSWHDQDVRDYWARELPDRVIHLGHLSEEELRLLYAKADIFLYPSLYEGFGLPILEAQASGCPVLTSTLKSCPEVAGKGAHYVVADSVQSIRDGILRIVQDRTYRQHLVHEGYKNVERFSWERCGDQYLELMRTIN
jgi:glycosyltransferase involved in cell wall biosynthesis